MTRYPRPEPFVCPDRMPDPHGVFKIQPKEDQWDVDRWTPDGRVAQSGKVEWNCASFYPRSCSYCGCIHPEDAIKLLEEGWELEATDKGYKRYLNPPGYHSKMKSMLKRFDAHLDAGTPDPALSAPQKDCGSPSPPVKLYTSHVTAEQANRINILHYEWCVRNGIRKEPPPGYQPSKPSEEKAYKSPVVPPYTPPPPDVSGDFHAKAQTHGLLWVLLVFVILAAIVLATLYWPRHH